MKLTIAIISKSETLNKLVRESIDFAEEIIIIVDSPTKKTKKLAKVNYFYRELAGDFASQRNFALQKAHNDWILFIDDDEYVGTELAREIKQLPESANISGYLIKRVDVCFHQPLLHGETGNTKLLRLGNKSKGKFIRSVHETWKINGEIGEIQSPIYHIKDTFISKFIGRMSYYAGIDANALSLENKPFSYWRLILNPMGKFVLNYFIRLGFLDGSVGLFLSYMMSVQSLTVRIFQWTKRN